MADLITQFVKLPVHIRAALSSPEALERLDLIESKFNVKLAEVVMRIAIKELAVSTLAQELVSKHHLSESAAKACSEDLIHNILNLIAGHLGLPTTASTAVQSAQNIAHESSLGIVGKDTEIERHANRLQYSPANQNLYDAPGLTSRLLATIGQTALPVNLKKRFEKAIESRLVDARSMQETKERLMRPDKIGGLGLSEIQAQTVMNVVETEHKKIHDLHLRVKTVEALEPVKPKVAPFKEPQHLHPLQSRQVTPPQAVPLQPVGEVKPKPQALVVPPVIPPATPPNKPFQAPPPQPLPPQPAPEVIRPRVEVPHFMPRMYRPSADAMRPTVADIRPSGKLVGPVEELRALTLQDFRMLGENNEERSVRLKQKIRLLEKESFEKRSEGVKALRQSPLMQEYISLGRDSMERNTSIGQLISERRSLGKQTLSEDEFETLGSLSASLRY